MRTFRIIFLAVLVLGIAVNSQAKGMGKVCFQNSNKGKEVCINVEIANTVDEQMKGLQFRKSLKENAGMLFVFDQPRMVGFWMKDMKIPLDMIWLDAENKIITLHQNIPPCQENPCMTYAATKEIVNVLEVKAGMVEKWGLKEGDVVNIKLK